MQDPLHEAEVTSPPAPEDSVAFRPVRVYTPSQVALGALLGGPMGVIYFLWTNFQAMDRPSAANRTIAWGMVAFAALVLLIMRMPQGPEAYLLTLAYVVIAGQIARRYQMSREDIGKSALYRRQSNWLVVGIGLLCSLLSLVVALVVALAFHLLGVHIR